VFYVCLAPTYLANNCYGQECPIHADGVGYCCGVAVTFSRSGVAEVSTDRATKKGKIRDLLSLGRDLCAHIRA